MSDALPQADHLFTYADYKNWELAPGERYELIYGAAYAMAAPNEYHQSISGELFRQIANYLYGKPCKVYSAPFDVRLFYEAEEDDDTVVQPDIAVICDKEKRGPEGGRGAPDFVAEILSPSNTAIEMERKFQLYRQAGVREYWVVNPENKGITAYRFAEDAAALPADQILTRTYGAKDTAPVAIFPDLEIALESVFAE
jgi:Uma2 family endonuclease